MPGPLDAFERIDTLPGNPPPPIAEPPPPPGPSTFLGNLKQAFSGERLVTRSDRADAEGLRLQREYGPIVDALGLPATENPAGFDDQGIAQAGFGGAPMLRRSELAARQGRGIGDDMVTRSEQEAMIAAEIVRRRKVDAKFLDGVPDNVAGLHQWMLAREEARKQAAAQRVERTSGFGGLLGSFAGGAFEYSIDTPNLLTLPAGGFGRTAGVRILTEGLALGAVTAAEQPKVAQNRAALGEDYTAGDFFGNVGSAALGGVLFRGGIEGGGLLGRAMGERARSAFPAWARQRDADAFGRAMNRAVEMGSFSEGELPSVAARLMGPEFGILSTDAAKRQLRREIEAGTIDHRALAEHFRLAVPEEMRTPDEKAALAGIGFDADLAEGSPYRPTPEGDLAHQQNIEAATRRLVDPSTGSGQARPSDVPRATPKPLATIMHPNDVVRFVLNDLEGGAKVVHYGEADGGTTKFGIAQRNHPGVDVASLSEDQAAEIARKRYWLPEFYEGRPDVAPIAFDAYFLHGDKKFALKLAAMDDPAQALRAYRAMLNHIADTVPGKEKYRKGWNARLDKLGARLGIEDAPFAPAELRPAFAADEPGVEILDRETLAASARPDEDAAASVRRQVQEALAASRPVSIEDGFGSRRIVGLSEEGLIDQHGATVRPEEIAAPADDAPARVLLGPEPPPALEVQPKAPPRRSGPVHLMQAIADAGGLRDNEGHDLIKGRGIPRFVLGAGTIVRRESGLSVDAMGEHLWEQGWFGPHATTPRPTENDVLQLIERGAREKLYRPDEQAAALARAAARDAMPEDDVRFELASHAGEHGLHLDPQTMDEALMHRAGGETIEGAVARAVHDAALRDVTGAADGAARLDAEEAAGWQAQVDSIEHDLRMDAEGDPHLTALFEQLDRDEEGARALRACMTPARAAE